MSGTATAEGPLDPRTAATVSITWILIANKPFYPFYVAWLTDGGWKASLATLIATPLLVAIVLLAKRFPCHARIALPLVGTLDTLLATRVFGSATGTELFLAPCMMLAALSFHARERWTQRIVAAAVFAAFLVSRWLLGPSLHVWNAGEAAALLNLNAFAVASLMAFIALRYAGSSDPGVVRGQRTD